jgi:hypothetical protein
MKTRNGVYYDLTKSTYKFKVPDTNITFVFSSDLRMMKFEDQYLKNRDEHNIKQKARFGFTVDEKTKPDIVLYKRIEKVGFLVINEWGRKLCLENLILTGETATLKN